jgi:hypothetical protein
LACRPFGFILLLSTTLIASIHHAENYIFNSTCGIGHCGKILERIIEGCTVGNNLLKAARTIADLAGADDDAISVSNLAEALQYRPRSAET